MPINGSIRLLVQFLVSPNVEPLSGFDCIELILYLDSVVSVVEELAASDGAHDGVGGVAHDVVRRDGRQVGRRLRVHAPGKQSSKWRKVHKYSKYSFVKYSN